MYNLHPTSQLPTRTHLFHKAIIPHQHHAPSRWCTALHIPSSHQRFQLAERQAAGDALGVFKGMGAANGHRKRNQHCKDRLECRTTRCCRGIVGGGGAQQPGASDNHTQQAKCGYKATRCGEALEQSGDGFWGLLLLLLLQTHDHEWREDAIQEHHSICTTCLGVRRKEYDVGTNNTNPNPA